MNIKQLNNREKLLAAAVIVVLLLGGYGYLRLEPRISEIDLLDKQKENTLNRIATLEIPDEPQEKIDEIVAQLDDQEKALEAIKDNAGQIEMQLAPWDSQQLKVQISALARDSKILIKVNQALKPEPIIINKSRAEKNTEDLVVPPNAGWIRRLSPGSMYARPLQSLTIEGDFSAIRRFVHGLEGVSFQVTIVRINIEKLDLAPLRGMSQLLRAELVLAL